MSVEWQCDRCGSDRWVGHRYGLERDGHQRNAQCVPCGHVQDLPEVDQVFDRVAAAVEAAWDGIPQ